MHLRLTLLLAVALTSCIRDDPNHCANQTEEDGDAYCVRKYEPGAFCSKCTPVHDGCSNLADIPDGCRPDNVLTATDDDGSTDSSDASMSMSMSDSIADDSATSTSMTADTTADDGSSSSTTGPPQPVCGNGDQEELEVCDTDEEFPCSQFMQGEGMARCDQMTCTFDFSDCSNQVPICGDGISNQPDVEECDVADFDEQTCGMQPGHGNKGELACTEDCEIDASGCCLDAGEPCEMPSQCCTGLCGLLGDGPNCVLGD